MTNTGYIEKRRAGYEGELSIDGVDLSPVTGLYFRDGRTHWLLVKRKRILEYDIESQSYKTRMPSPSFEVYLKKEKPSSNIAFRGTFVFFKFKYTIVGIWDKDKKDKLKLIVDRLPMNEQNIIKKINKLYERND